MELVDPIEAIEALQILEKENKKLKRQQREEAARREPGRYKRIISKTRMPGYRSKSTKPKKKRKHSRKKMPL